MGRRHDEERTRQNRTRGYPGGYEGRGYEKRGYDQRGYRDQDYDGPYFDRHGERYFVDPEGHRFYEERPQNPYGDRDREREGYWREREQRQETRRTGMMVIGGICVAVIALLGVMAVTGDDSSQSAQQVPQQQGAPQQPVPQQPAPQQPQPVQPQAPAAPRPDGASSEQVEGLRADLERQLAEIRQSINELRLDIMGWFGSDQAEENSQ